MFKEAYRDPTDEIIHLDLYQEDIRPIDADVLRGWGKIRSGSSFDQLSDGQRNEK